MASNQSFPTRGSLRRPRFSALDAVVFAAIAVLLVGIVRLAHAMNANVVTAHATVSTNPSHLPYYAARSLLRMFIALGLSVIFTFVYATAAARSRRARVVLLPILDILQSVPILGFLAVVITFFIALFPGSILGLECASIFAIFTSQAWNMTFSMYHSLITQPKELDEAARMFRLTKWERFWQLDLPSSMIGLVWNGMMSFGGGWFFLAASEAISVGTKNTYALPGIGSYVQAAVNKGDLNEVGIAIVVMIIMVIGVNILFWRPLVAYAEKFRVETSEAAEQPKSYVLNFLRQSRIPSYVAAPLRPVGRQLDRITRPFGLAEYPLYTPEIKRRAGDVAATVVGSAVVGYGVYRAVVYFDHAGVFHQFGHCLLLGSATFLRVFILVIVATLIWVPVGVKIGMNPRLARYAQPVVQVLASFPAILLFPFAIVIFIHLGLTLNIGGIFLMALGAQWYVLFNVIAGASAIPTDLRELMDQFRVPWKQKWRELILPGIFPYYVTGGITAAGGAWNASIVAEIATYGKHHLLATGLGAYIAQATAKDNLPEVLTGVIVMSFYVVVVNRLLWRRLYHLAETKYSF
jgi:NitT/TauT family transport system permease protein